LRVARLGVRLPWANRRREPDRHGVGVEQHGREVHPGDPVHERVVRLADQREPVALEALHEPHLPERLGPIQALREDPADQERELVVVTGRRQRRVPDVVLDVHPWVVHPQRLAGAERRERELLPVARDKVQARFDVLHELVVARRRPLEHADPADVHVRGLLLLGEEARVGRTQPV
jgi:hypothetical protein